MSIAIGYVHPGKVHHGFMECVMQALFQLPGTVLIPQYATANLARFRNRVVSSFLDIAEPKMDGLLFVDTDILFEVRDVQDIILSPHPITSALYRSLSSDGKRFPVFNVGSKAFRVANEDDVKAMAGIPNRVAGVGMGFCYIHREVLEHLGAGDLFPFEEKIVKGIPLSEDIGFCVNASENGWSSWIDPRIEVDHYKEVIV